MTKTDEKGRFSGWTVWSPGVIYPKRIEGDNLPQEVRERLQVAGTGGKRVELIFTAEGEVYMLMAEGEVYKLVVTGTPPA